MNIWSNNGEHIRAICEHTGSVLSMDWNKDSTGLISGSSDHTIRFLYAYNVGENEPDELCC